MPGLEQARGPIRQRLKNKENKKKNLTKDRERKDRKETVTFESKSDETLTGWASEKVECVER